MSVESAQTKTKMYFAFSEGRTNVALDLATRSNPENFTTRSSLQLSIFVGTGSEWLFVAICTGSKSVAFLNRGKFSEFCETFFMVSDNYFLRLSKTHKLSISLKDSKYMSHVLLYYLSV